jgi:hypothetical protein
VDEERRCRGEKQGVQVFQGQGRAGRKSRSVANGSQICVADTLSDLDFPETNAHEIFMFYHSDVESGLGACSEHARPP